MKWIEDYQVFLFDFDGLLVDTEPLHFDAYKRMCRARGFELQWNFEKFCKIAHAKASGMREGVYAEFPELFRLEPSWEVLYQEKKQAYEQLLKEGKLELMSGAKQILEALQKAGKKRCVVTNSPLKQIEIIRDSLPILQTIPLWITRECYQNPKPAPDGYLKAIEMLADKQDRIIGFEDSLKGLESLYAAGAKPVLICPSDSSQVAECPRLEAAYFPSFMDISLG